MELFEINKNTLTNKIGGKGKSLQFLIENNFNVPKGFIIPTTIFEKTLKEKINKINLILNQTKNEINSINQASKKINKLFENIQIDEKNINKILNEFEKLNLNIVAVRSSANVEDGKENAWAGIFDSFLNIKKENLIKHILKCYKSLFSQRAISYKIQNNLVNQNISIAIIIQEMIPAEISGVGFSINPTKTFSNEIIIEAGFGLGEYIVSGKISPDIYTINKETFEVDKNINIQKIGLYQNGEIDFGEKYSNKEKLSNEQIIEVSKKIIKIEKIYQLPIDIEFAYFQDRLYILQARPITGILNKNIQNHEIELIKYIENSNWMNFKNTKRNLLSASIWAEGIRNPITSILKHFPVEDIEVITKNQNCLRCFKVQTKEDSLNLELKRPEIILEYINESYKLLTQIKKNIKITNELIEKNNFIELKKIIFESIEIYKQIGFYECYTNTLIRKLIKTKQKKTLKINKIINKSKKWRNDEEFDNKFIIFRLSIEHYINKNKINIDSRKIIKYLHFKELKKLFEEKIGNEKLKEIILNREKKGYVMLNLNHRNYKNETIDAKHIKEHIETHIRNIHKEITDKKIEGNTLKGQSTFKSNKIIEGECIVINQEEDLKPDFDLKNKILITTMTTPMFVPYLKNIKGIITDNGGTICHAAIISRELKLPTIIGTEAATKIFKTGNKVQMNLNKGTIVKIP